jgi:signal transduction histidine kinase
MSCGEMLTFGTRIRHDLRTPLGSVLTTAEMLREILGEDAPQDVPLIQPISIQRTAW